VDWKDLGEGRLTRNVARAQRTLLKVALSWTLVCVLPNTAAAQELVTSLVDIRQGSELSTLAQSLGEGGYELQDGTWVSFDEWYRTDWPEVHVELLTQYSEDSGITWGFSTGERGEKYELLPSLKLGVITQTHPKPTSTLALSLATTLLGNLEELPCEADYGELGSFSVNCRLAASELAPEDTLRYLVKAQPAQFKLSMSYRGRF